MEGRRQRRLVEASAQPFAPAGDVAYPGMHSAIVVERRKPGERRRLLAGQAADLRHAHQDSDRGLEPDTVHAFDQIEPFRQVVMLADGRHQLLELGPQKLGEMGDSLLPELADPRITAAFTAVLEAGDVIGELIDQRHPFGQRDQARIGRRVAVRGVVDLQLLTRAMDRYIELVFAGIDPGADHARLAHLRRPFLVMRTYSSFNHPGPMKNRPRSCYEGSPKGCGWARSDDR